MVTGVSVTAGAVVVLTGTIIGRDVAHVNSESSSTRRTIRDQT
jgi:hypothetical protein